MAANTPVDCLYTTVMNPSTTEERTFSFLPPHGRKMLPGEQLTVAGNLVDRLASKTSSRQFQAMERALAGGFIVIVSTPAVFLSNNPPEPVYPNDVAELPTSQMLDGTDGALGLTDPCWVPET